MWRLVSRSVDAHLLIAHWEFLMHAWMLYLFGILTCWLCWLICLDWDFQYHDFMCFIDIFVWGIDMLVCCWLIVLYCLAHWLWFCHDCSGHLTCIHSPLYIIWLDMLIHLLVYYLDRPLSMMFISLFVLIVVFSLILCVHGDISEHCLIVCCMTAIFLCDCMPLVSVGSTFIPLPPTLWFRSFPSSRFSLLQMWGLVCACTLTELEVRSRV